MRYSANPKGFTLIELLVVIAIIALLMSILLPSLQIAKELASSAVCLSNQKGLCTAWLAYADDNDGYLVGGSNYYQGSGGTPYRWVEYPLYNETDDLERGDPRPTGTDITFAHRINGIRAGKLFKYTGDPQLYHCPGDKNQKRQNPPFQTFRSYSIVGLMNSEDFVSRERSSIYSPITEYRTATISPSGTQKTLKVAVKMSDVIAPGDKFVFVEEDAAARGQEVNDGGLVLLYGTNYDWWDAPAYFHNDSCTIGFADGHAERHRWEDPDTIEYAKNPDLNKDPDPAHNADLAWIVRGYIPCR